MGTPDFAVPTLERLADSRLPSKQNQTNPANGATAAEDRALSVF